MNLTIFIALVGMVFASPNPGNLEVKKTTVTIPDFDCGDGTFQSGNVRLYYPAELKGPYPIVSFLHGAGGGQFDNLNSNIASLGMVVVAPLRGVCNGDWSMQQIWAVKGAELNQNLHPAFAQVDFNKVGIIGHSRGGAFTLGTAGQARDHGLNVKAYVASHGGGPNAAANIPADIPGLFTTGSRDPRRRKFYPAFDIAKSRPKIWASLAGGAHMSPARSGYLNEFCAHFLACHVKDREESCELTYGDSADSLCHKNQMEACNIVKAPTLGSTPPGSLEILKTMISMPGFDCGDRGIQNGAVAVYYPKELQGPYPIVSFLHGSGGGRFENLNYNIASLGMVVVAAQRSVCAGMTVKQIWAVKGAQQNQDLHPVFSKIDYNSVGAIGHSMGGAWTMNTAAVARSQNFPLKAYVASHGGSGNAAGNIPADIPGMYNTGNRDPRGRRLWWYYSAAPSRPKIFASLNGGRHMEPMGAGRLNEFSAHFLACHVMNKNESCELIYGDSDESLCHKNAMAVCDIQKDVQKAPSANENRLLKNEEKVSDDCNKKSEQNTSGAKGEVNESKNVPTFASASVAI